jgi:osmoprotectant transport system permease protein
VSDLINFFVDNPGLLAQKAAEHIALSALAIAIAVAIALPAGVLLGHKHRGSLFAINLSNILRALPSLALIAISLAFFGLSVIDIQIALVALALPPILTNAYTAVDSVEPDAVEAARGMGMTGAQLLRRVELPLALPLLFTGIRVSAVTIVATAPIAAIAGGGGLGDIIVNQASYRLSGVLGASFCVMLLSAVVFIALAGAQSAVTPRGVRRTSVIGEPQRREMS